jgi:glycosyltransferase involved in cell wall biosynthesis
MKVALICSEKLPVPPIRGGAIQLYIDGIVPFLIKKHQVTVLSISDPELKDYEIVDGVEYCRVPAVNKNKYVELVSRELSERQFDMVHIFNRPKFLRFFHNASPGSNFILSLHNEMFAPDKIGNGEADFCLKTVRQVITVSEFIKKTVLNNYPLAGGKIKTIYSGVDPDEFHPIWTKKAREIKQKIIGGFGIGNSKIVLAVTRFSVKKGVHLVISAMEEVLKKNPQTVLIVVGSKWYGSNRIDEYVSHVYKLAKNIPEKNVVFTGFIPPRQVAKFFSASDIFVCASQWQEPLARIHYEAMAAGLPIITTDRGGNAEVVEGYGNGIVVPEYNNSGDFAWAINFLLENPLIALAMGRRGRKLAEEKYNWGRVAREIMEIYDTVENC